MDPSSEINTVHTTQLEGIYPHVAAYLRDPDPHRRRSYNPYLGSVYKLRDKEQAVTFQSECLLPRNDQGRPRVLLLFSNAHPESIKNGMFHTAQGKVAALWTDLCHAGLFSGDQPVLESPQRLRDHCLNVAYDGQFAFGFACYWIFPTFQPDHLRKLFGPEMQPPGSENPKARLNRLLAEWRPEAIISFNGQVLEALTGENTKGYMKRLRQRTLEEKYRASGHEYRVIQTYPTGWRYVPHAPKFRQRSLKRITSTIKGLR